MTTRRTGILWQAVVGIISDSVEVFDDTKIEPSKQFKDVRKITSLNVTDRDLYDKTASTTNKASFTALMGVLEAIEQKATSKLDQNLLLDLLLTLSAHDSSMKSMATTLRNIAGYIDYAEYALTGEWDTYANSVRMTLTNVSSALLNRFVGEIEDNSDKVPDKNIGKRGSLVYLLKESHSVSRRVLNPEVKIFLQRMMG